MGTFRRVLAAIGTVELAIAVVAFTFVVVLTTFQVLYRYSLGGSIWWGQEVAQLAMLIAYFFGIAYVYKAKQDVVISFMVNRLSHRRQIALAIFAHLLTAMFCLIVMATGLELAPHQLVFFTYILGIPRFYSTLPLIIASASMALTATYYAIAAWQSRDASPEMAHIAERDSLIVVGPEV